MGPERHLVLQTLEFGAHFKVKGWRLGLLVARNVTLGNGQGGGKPRAISHKVSARDFAEEAGISNSTVGLYLAGWNDALAFGGREILSYRQITLS